MKYKSILQIWSSDKEEDLRSHFLTLIRSKLNDLFDNWMYIIHFMLQDIQMIAKEHFEYFQIYQLI